MSETAYDRLAYASQLLELGRYEQALPIFQDCLTEGVLKILCLQSIFDCYVHLDKKGKALETAKLALKLYPDNANSIILSALYANTYSKPKEALQYAQYALEIDPVHRIALEVSIRNYIKINQLRQVEPFMEALEQNYPNDLSTFKCKAIFEMSKGQNLEAINIIKEGLSLYPESQTLQSLYLKANLANNSNLPELEELAYQNVQKDPTDELAKASLLDVLKSKNWLLRFFAGNSFSRYVIEWTPWRVILMILFWKGTILWGSFGILYLLVSWYGGVLYNSIIRLHQKFSLLLLQQDVDQSNLFLGAHVLLLLFIAINKVAQIGLPLYMILSCFFFMLMVAVSWFEIRTQNGKYTWMGFVAIMSFPMWMAKSEPIVLTILSLILLLIYAFLFTLRIAFK